jgi:hypothetical protein
MAFEFLMLRLIDTLRNPVLDRPLAHLLIVAAHPRRTVVRPWVAIVERKAERKHVHVRLAHDELPQCINAVVEVAVQVHGLRRCVAAQLRIVGLPVGLSEQVQAVELVEDFDSDAVATFTGGWVGHHEGTFGVHVHLDHLFAGDHRVRDWILVSDYRK